MSAAPALLAILERLQKEFGWMMGPEGWDEFMVDVRETVNSAKFTATPHPPNDQVELPPNGGSESKKGVVGG